MANSSLSDNAEIVMGQSPPGEKCNNDGLGLPLLNGPTEYGLHHPMPVQFTTDSRKRARQGDILFCVRGSTTGRMNWADRDYAIGRGIAAIRHKSIPALQPFVRAVIEYGLPGLLAQATGSTFPNVSAGQLACLWWPPLEEVEQRAISKILGTLDDKIELNRRMNKTLESIARAIFKSWFVAFDPVRAKAGGRQPTGMDAETAAQFPDSFEDSELGKIPKGWKPGVLENIAYNSRTSVRPDNLSPDMPYIGLEHMPRKSIALSEWNDAGEIVSNKYAFSKGDLLFGKLRPYFHKVGVAPIDGVCSTDILVIQPTQVEFSAIVLMTIASDDFIAYTDMSSTGTRMPRTNWSDMSRYQVIIPPPVVAAAFNRLVNTLVAKIQENICLSSTLAGIRDTLLPKLISGEIRVKDAEKSVEELDEQP